MHPLVNIYLLHLAFRLKKSHKKTKTTQWFFPCGFKDNIKIHLKLIPNSNNRCVSHSKPAHLLLFEVRNQHYNCWVFFKLKRLQFSFSPIIPINKQFFNNNFVGYLSFSKDYNHSVKIIRLVSISTPSANCWLRDSKFVGKHQICQITFVYIQTHV